MLSIDKEYYNTLIQDDARPRNRAKVHAENIGRRHVVYTFSPNGSENNTKIKTNGCT